MASQYKIQDLRDLIRVIEAYARDLELIGESDRLVLEEPVLNGHQGYFLKVHGKSGVRTQITVPLMSPDTGDGYLGSTKTETGKAMRYMLDGLRAVVRSAAPSRRYK